MKPVTASLRAYLDALVHPSARGDVLRAARHRAFIGAHLAGGACALAALPVFLAVNGAPGTVEAAVFAWLLAPLAIAVWLSRTGRFEVAHLLSALTMAGLVASVGAISGGLTSFVVPWLVVVPLEAALAGSRRVIAVATTLAAGVAAALFALGAAGLLPVDAAQTANAGTLWFISLFAAVIYSAGLAVSAAHIAAAGERQTRAHEARYHMLAQNMTDAVTRHARSGGVVFASPAAQALFGAPSESLLDNGLFERVHVGDRPAYLTALATALHDGAAEIELRVRRGPAEAGEGAFIWVELRARAVDGWPAADRAGTDGKAPSPVVGRQVVAVIRDISERKRNEMVLADARESAELADLAKTRFLASMSHELRTPLNAIIGFSEILMSGDASMVPAERRADYARLIHESGQHLLSVVNGILDLSRIESGGFELLPESFELKPLVASCISMMALKAEQSGVQLVCDLEAAPREVLLDKRALRQVVLNLLSNAVKFTPKGGSVTISVAMSGADYVLRVADTGIGIADDDLRRLGQPFFQARSSYDRPYEGTGLGLSVVKGLAALQGGRVEITSRVGAGTVVAVHLPTPAASGREAGGNVARLPRRHGGEVNDLQKRRA
ncbi:PAS domain-containing sensor histidine kinase [Bosea sp. 117]|uniref:PAS domain-containing sensor histidine kinase n=1 Tax=Bosea sp. 117 TaxID=1125973 RepID=UPI000494A224|nr:PAS domain-containing sensor histidine kinase [Bosea sp. 117]